MTDERFENAEREFFKLKGQLAAGRITSEQFDRALKELIVEDMQGRFWMLGADSGKWYVHDGQSWVEANPPGVAQRESQIAPAPSPAPAPPPPAPKPQGARRSRAILGTIVGGLLTLSLGLAVTWGQGALRTAFLGAATTPMVIFITATPLLQTNLPTPVNPPTPVVVVVTATPLPSTNTPTRTNTPTATLTNTPVSPKPTATATVTTGPIVVPTFPASVVTWSSGYDKTVGKPVNIVANKTFSTRPLEIYATWNPTGVPTGSKLQAVWYYNGALWTQGEYVLLPGDDSIWHSVYRQDGQPLVSGIYRVEIKIGTKIILTDEARVLNP